MCCKSAESAPVSLRGRTAKYFLQASSRSCSKAPNRARALHFISRSQTTNSCPHIFPRSVTNFDFKHGQVTNTIVIFEFALLWREIPTLVSRLGCGFLFPLPLTRSCADDLALAAKKSTLPAISFLQLKRIRMCRVPSSLISTSCEETSVYHTR